MGSRFRKGRGEQALLVYIHSETNFSRNNRVTVAFVLLRVGLRNPSSRGVNCVRSRRWVLRRST